MRRNEKGKQQRRRKTEGSKLHTNVMKKDSLPSDQLMNSNLIGLHFLYPQSVLIPPQAVYTPSPPHMSFHPPYTCLAS